MGTKKDRGLARSTVVGVVALVFLIMGYQTALFVHSAAVARVAANRDEPDTVFVYRELEGRSFAGAQDDRKSAQDDRKDGHADRVGVQSDLGKELNEREIMRKSGRHSATGEVMRVNLPRKVESFRFDPNSVSFEELQRLGFSEKQALSIVNYREKGGRFRRKADFAKSFVVSDSIFKRLEPYIDIPLIDLNEADSAAFDALPGIGGWFASKMVAYRKELGGYSFKEQLMDIYRFDKGKFEALEDLVTIGHPYVYPLWELPVDSLRKHPYIGNYETARAIVLFRENNPPAEWTVENLSAAGVLSAEQAVKMSMCVKIF